MYIYIYMYIHIHSEMITTIKLIDISITSPNYLYVCSENTSDPPLSKFQVHIQYYYSSMLYIRFSRTD